MGAINRRTCPVFPGLVYRVQHRKRDKSRHKRRYKGNAAGGTDNPHIQTVQRRINRGGENQNVCFAGAFNYPVRYPVRIAENE